MLNITYQFFKNIEQISNKFINSGFKVFSFDKLKETPINRESCYSRQSFIIECSEEIKFTLVFNFVVNHQDYLDFVNGEIEVQFLIFDYQTKQLKKEKQIRSTILNEIHFINFFNQINQIIDFLLKNNRLKKYLINYNKIESMYLTLDNLLERFNLRIFLPIASKNVNNFIEYILFDRQDCEEVLDELLNLIEIIGL